MSKGQELISATSNHDGVNVADDRESGLEKGRRTQETVRMATLVRRDDDAKKPKLKSASQADLAKRVRQLKVWTPTRCYGARS